MARPRSPSSDPGLLMLNQTIGECLRLARPARALIASPKRIHELRIATRRAQCAAVILEPRLGSSRTAKLIAPLRQLRRAAGRARDTRVRIKLLKTELKPLDNAARRLIDLLRERHQDDLDHLRRSAKRRRAELVRALKIATHRLETPGPAFETLAARAGRGIRAELRELIRGSLDDAARLHRVRRAFKRLRYTLELAGPRPGRAATAELRALGRLQDDLGVWNDLRITLEAVPRSGRSGGAARAKLQRRTTAAQKVAARAARAGPGRAHGRRSSARAR